MFKPTLSAVLLALLFSQELGATAVSKFRRSTRPADGMYIVAINPGDAGVDRAVEMLLQAYGGKLTHIFRGEPWQGFTVSGLPEAAAIALSLDPLVQIVEQDTVAVPLEVAPPQTADWARDRTNQRTRPLDNSVAAGCSSTTSVYLYVMDTGIDDPSGTQFGTRLIHGYRDPSLTSFADSYPNGGHGTAVASIAAGATYGVGGQPKVVNVKVYGTGLGAGAAAQAIREFINVHDTWNATSFAYEPKLVNMSLHYAPTSDGYSLLESDIQYSVSQHRVTYVVGAGNDYSGGDGRDACVSGTPGRLGRSASGVKDNGIITVGAVYSPQTNGYTTERRSVHPLNDGAFNTWASDYGACVDMFAPGTRVAAMSKTGAAREFSGTSAASPYVAGATSRMLYSMWLSDKNVQPASVEARMRVDATPDVIEPATLGAGSPNLLLYRVAIGKCRSAY